MAKEIADSGAIQINGKTAKASSEIKVGDILSIRISGVTTDYVIKAIYENATSEKAETMYERKVQAYDVQLPIRQR